MLLKGIARDCLHKFRHFEGFERYPSYFAVNRLFVIFARLDDARMAESVDALVSNTSGAIRAGSTPAPGTWYGTPPPDFPAGASVLKEGTEGIAVAAVLAALLRNCPLQLKTCLYAGKTNPVSCRTHAHGEEPDFECVPDGFRMLP